MFSGIILLAVIIGVLLFYRHGVRHSGQAPELVGQPVGQTKSAPPAQSGQTDAASGLQVGLLGPRPMPQSRNAGAGCLRPPRRRGWLSPPGPEAAHGPAARTPGSPRRRRATQPPPAKLRADLRHARARRPSARGRPAGGDRARRAAAATRRPCRWPASRPRRLTRLRRRRSPVRPSRRVPRIQRFLPHPPRLRRTRLRPPSPRRPRRRLMPRPRSLRRPRPSRPAPPTGEPAHPLRRPSRRPRSQLTSRPPRPRARRGHSGSVHGAGRRRFRLDRGRQPGLGRRDAPGRCARPARSKARSRTARPSTAPTSAASARQSGRSGLLFDAEGQGQGVLRQMSPPPMAFSP